MGQGEGRSMQVSRETESTGQVPGLPSQPLLGNYPEKLNPKGLQGRGQDYHPQHAP